MARPAGTNCLTDSEDRLLAMLANCPQMQTFLGVENDAAALLRMYTDAATLPADVEGFTAAEWAAMLPYVLAGTDDEEGFVLRKVAEPTSFIPSGRLWFQLKQFVASADITDWEKYHRDFKNHVGTPAIGPGLDMGDQVFLQRIDRF